MTSIIKLTPLSGAKDEGPLSYILQIDDFCFLLDCGWDESLEVEKLDNLHGYINQIDAVLLSFPDVYHLGSLAYIVGKWNLSCPIYATVPVYKMGQMFMYDLYQSRHNEEDFTTFTLDDVDSAFDRIIHMKYSQTLYLKGKGEGLTITPLPAGHMVGGTVWKISKNGEEDIVYMVDYNHKKERHLNCCNLEALGRPSLLITDCYNALYHQERRRQRDEQLLTNVVNTLRNDGNVLICIDTAGRVLELCHLLDQLWRNQESGLSAYSLALLNNVSYNVVEFAKSQMEWMSEKVQRLLEENRSNAFQLRHVALCHSLADVARVPSPKVVLASQPDVESGFARELFLRWAGGSANSVILTTRTSPGTLARRLIEKPGLETIGLKVKQRVALTGEELEAFNLQNRDKQVAATEVGRDSEEEEEAMETGEEGNASETRVPRKPVMFPFTESRIKWDHYGQQIRHEDFMLTDSGPVYSRKADSSREAVEAAAEVPTKCIVKEVEVEVKCSVVYIDFEGRSDGESMKKILSQIKPRQVALVHGAAESTAHFAEFCSRNVVSSGGAPVVVYAPAVGESIDATTERHIYQVRLTDHLVSSLTFHRSKDVEVAWLDGAITFDSQNQESWTERDQTDNKLSKIPTLISANPSKVKGHDTVFLNELRLNEFKQVLSKNGIHAEFNGGVLICNNVVGIRRNEHGKLCIEGCLSDDYYTVRDILYRQYAML